MAGQQRDVFRALAKRGDRQGHDIQAIEQVSAELTASHARFQILIGGGDEPDIYLFGARAAHRPHLAFLQHAQELRLQGGRKIGDFVQEDAAPVRQLQQPHLVRHGAREGPFDVAEQFAFDHAFREAGAIHDLVRPVMVGTSVMDGTRDQFLAGAGLSDDQDRGMDRRHVLDHPQKSLEHGADADERLETFTRDGHAPERPVLVQNFRHAHGPVDAGRQHLGVDGFGDVIKRAVPDGFDRRIQGIDTAHHEDRNGEVLRLHPLQKLDAADARHADIGQHHVNLFLFQRLEGAFGAGHDLEIHATALVVGKFLLQGPQQNLRVRRLVVHKQDPKQMPLVFRHN